MDGKAGFVALTGRGRACVTVLALVFAACTSSGEPSRSDDGYDLISVDGTALPVDYGPIVERGPDTLYTSKCRLLVTSGYLRLNEPTLVFNLEYSTTNSCTGALMTRIVIDGSYAVSGKRLSFREPAAIPPDFTFDGEITGDRIVISFSGQQTMVFRR